MLDLAFKLDNRRFSLICDTRRSTSRERKSCVVFGTTSIKYVVSSALGMAYVLSPVHRLREQKDNGTNAVFTPPRLRYGRAAGTIKPRSRPTCYCPLSFFPFLLLSFFPFVNTRETFFTLHTLHNNSLSMFSFSSFLLTFCIREIYIRV